MTVEDGAAAKQYGYHRSSCGPDF